MRKGKTPPVKVPLLTPRGTLAPQWLMWFQEVGMFFDNYRRTPDRVLTANTTLSTDDFGKLIRVDTGISHITINLMPASSKDINGWLTLMRTGTGRLTIVPDSAAQIEYGSLGGRIWCEETRRKAPNVTLQLITATIWGIIGATGIWKVA